MIVSLFSKTDHNPILSVHGDCVKIDFCSVLLEVDIEGFKDMIRSMLAQAAEQGINFGS